MNSVLRLVLVCLWALAAGCGGEPKEPPPPTGPSTAPASPRNTNRIAEAPPATVIADSGDVNATLQQLTQSLRDYVVRTRTVPKNFDEFASKSQVRFPPPPAGKKYAIQGQQVVLLNR